MGVEIGRLLNDANCSLFFEAIEWIAVIELGLGVRRGRVCWGARYGIGIYMIDTVIKIRFRKDIMQSYTGNLDRETQTHKYFGKKR